MKQNININKIVVMAILSLISLGCSEENHSDVCDERDMKIFIQKLYEGDPKVLAVVEEIAEEGDANACFLAGLGNSGIQGGKVNEYRAFHFFEKSAMSGNETAMYFIGVMYCSGWGTAQDIALGKKWLQESAERGCLDARDKLNEVLKIEREAENMREAAMFLKELIITAAELNAASQGYRRY